MRRAMAEADVGDDVYGEDPSINALQERVASLVGTESALFVPSGTMANQIAIKVHTQPGDDILVGHDAHNWLFETGGAAAISGVQVTVLPGDGQFSPDDVRAARKPDDHHSPPTRLVSVENTHNMAGGVVWSQDALDRIVETSKELDLALHLDGARLCNAAVALNSPEHRITRGFDTISVCLSKGLGAPVGSLLCGSCSLIRRAHRVRKMLGGGMRQAGILAAAGLYALEHNRPRLSDDHEHARFLAQAASQVDGLTVDVDRVHTNIVMIDVDNREYPTLSAAAIADVAANAGVLFHAMSDTRIRLVTHLDVDRAACERAADEIARSVETLR